MCRLFNAVSLSGRVKIAVNQRIDFDLLHQTDKTPDLMLVPEAAKLTRIPEPVKMGERFAQGEGQLMHVQVAPEHQRHDVCC